MFCTTYSVVTQYTLLGTEESWSVTDDSKIWQSILTHEVKPGDETDEAEPEPGMVNYCDCDRMCITVTDRASVSR